MNWLPQLRFSWYDLKDSLWYRPAVMTLAALILSLVTLQFDHVVFGRREVELPWAFRGGVEGARGVLGAIASTMITVATTAFSVTLVALQLGSSQFSPRILRSFTGDRGNQMVLGIFIATFAYSLSVLRTIRSESDDLEAFVPTVSVTIAILLAFGAIASLIFFFHHATRTIQASVIIDRTYNDSRALIERTAQHQASANRRVLPEPMKLPEQFDRLLAVKSQEAGYLRDPNINMAVDIAKRNGLILELHAGVGEYLNPGMTLASLWRDNTEDEDGVNRDDLSKIADDIRSCFSFDIERTLENDPLFGMQQLSDISLLALSPGTNDPSTMHSVLDRIGTTLIDIERISGSHVVYADDDGSIRVFYPIPSFVDFARLPFDQIRHYGAVDPMVVTHVMQVLSQVAHAVSRKNAETMKQLALELWEGADRTRWIAADIKQVTEAAAWALDDQD